MRRELFDELLDSVKQAKAIERGELKPGRVFRVESNGPVVWTAKAVTRRKNLKQSR